MAITVKPVFKGHLNIPKKVSLHDRHLFITYVLGSDHLTSRGGGFEKNILALIFVKKNILASTQAKKNSLTLGMRTKLLPSWGTKKSAVQMMKKNTALLK